MKKSVQIPPTVNAVLAISNGWVRAEGEWIAFKGREVSF